MNKVLEDNKVENKKRENYIDLARGIAIIIMIFGHVVHWTPIRRMIYSFHMPVFFILSGYFFKNRSLKEELKRDFKSILIPYVIISIISLIIKFFIDNDNMINNIFTYLLGVGDTSNILENLSTVGEIWFLICLFFSKTLFVIINKINKKYLFCLCVFLNIVGVIISKIAFLPYSLDVVFVTQIYLYMGKYIKEHDLFNIRLSIKKKILLIGIWCLGVLLGEFNYVARFYPYYPICIITSIVASYTFIMICKYIDKIKIFEKLQELFQFCGKYSLYILCIHCLENQFIHYDNFIKFNSTILNYVIILLIKYILVLCCVKLILEIKNISNRKKLKEVR